MQGTARSGAERGDTLAAGEKDVVLVIADISGYTRFIAANRGSLTHSQIIITELMKSILRELKMPLRVAKLEGDAVFFYLCKEGNERAIAQSITGFTQGIDRIFAAFDRRIAQLIQSNMCPCAGCQSIAMLRLKMVVHSGAALFYRLERFTELSGFDVILVHRLLKNSVEGDEYVLLTEAARNELFPAEDRDFKKAEEHYDDVGTVSTYVYRPGGQRAEVPPGTYDSPLQRWKTHQIKVWNARLLEWGILKFRPFQHLPASADPDASP